MTQWFEPGYKAGGPIRSCVNLAYSLCNDYQLYVLTTDTDLGAARPYEKIKTKTWLDKGGFKTYYIPQKELSKGYIRQVIQELKPDFIYLNSMFANHFALYPLWLKWRRQTNAKVILAPRGMLKESALRFKHRKKSMFLFLLKQTDIYKIITFHATDELEAVEIRKHIHPQADLQVIPNLPQARQSAFTPIDKNAGVLHMIYLSRIHPIKKLDFLLKSLLDIKARVTLTIIGTMEDQLYWKSCQKTIQELPENVEVHHKGEIPHEQIDAELKKHHLFALPTSGENFGHAIFEAMLAGRPVLISDQTPWQQLDRKKAGWVYPLDDLNGFTQQIDEVASMNQAVYDAWSKGAWQLANDYIQTSDIKNQYLRLFA